MVNNHSAAEPLRILIVDDEPGIVRLLSTGLQQEGFAVETAADGKQTLEVAGHFQPHVILLDRMLPDKDGLDVMRALFQDPDVSVIVLTARAEVTDRIDGLKAGADDYIGKPFDFEELVARIQAVARSRHRARSEVLRAGPIVLDQLRMKTSVTGVAVNLTLKEYELLRLFLLHPRRVLSRQFVLERVWGYDFEGDDNNLEVYVGYLRRKLGDTRHCLIETVRGVGYRLSV